MMDYINVRPIPAALRGPLRAVLCGEAAAWPDGVTPEDERQFLAALDDHAMTPLVFARMEECGAIWPARISERLRSAAIHAAAIEPLRLSDLRELLNAMAEHGLRCLILKGTGLAYDIFEAPELRPRGDTDLLIERTEVDRVRELLQSIGYHPTLTSGDSLAVRQQSFARTDRFGINHVYDVHWDIANSPVVSDAMQFDELLARAIVVPRIGAHALTLSHVDALLLACIHRVAHHHDSDRLIWLYDIHLLHELLLPEEHQRFWMLAADRRVVTICSRSIELAEEWFARAAHDHARHWLGAEEIERDEASAAFLDRGRTRAAVLAGDMKALGWRERLRRMRELALPPAAFMRQSFPDAPRFALPWLYVYRGARGLLRLFRRVEAGEAR